MKNMVGQIGIMQTAIGKPALGKILDEEIPIAKKLRAHIKN
jgi:hypothetical protein